MTSFSATVQAHLAGNVVKCAPLVFFDFANAPTRLWPGFGDLSAGGYTWSGVGDLGSIGSLGLNQGGSSGQVVFSMSGVSSEILASAIGEVDDVLNRDVKVYLQFFQIDRTDANGNWIEWQTLDEPYVTWWGSITGMPVSRSVEDQGGGSSQQIRTISVTARNAFYSRSRPPYAYYTDRDQKGRHAGDNIFLNQAVWQNAVIRWPDF